MLTKQQKRQTKASVEKDLEKLNTILSMGMNNGVATLKKSGIFS